MVYSKDYPKFMTQKKLQQLPKSLKVPHTKSKKVPGNNFGYITFEVVFIVCFTWLRILLMKTTKLREDWMPVLQNHKINGKTLHVARSKRLQITKQQQPNKKQKISHQSQEADDTKTENDAGRHDKDKKEEKKIGEDGDLQESGATGQSKCIQDVVTPLWK